jgi:hypothetical protein
MRTVWLILPLLFVSEIGFAQSITGGTINGLVVDQSGAVIAGATVSLRNAGTNYEQSVTADEAGTFHLANIPLNLYRLTITAPGFNDAAQKVDVRSTIMIALPNIALTLGTNVTSVAVEANAPLVELDPSAHTNCDEATFSKLPEFGPAVGLSNLINNSTGGTAADANGFFQPLGDHAQVSFVIDGQPISDQQSKVFFDPDSGRRAPEYADHHGGARRAVR